MARGRLGGTWGSRIQLWSRVKAPSRVRIAREKGRFHGLDGQYFYKLLVLNDLQYIWLWLFPYQFMFAERDVDRRPSTLWEVSVRSSRGFESLTGSPSMATEPPTSGPLRLHQDGGERAEIRPVVSERWRGARER